MGRLGPTYNFLTPYKSAQHGPQRGAPAPPVTRVEEGIDSSSWRLLSIEKHTHAACHSEARRLLSSSSACLPCVPRDRLDTAGRPAARLGLDKIVALHSCRALVWSAYTLPPHHRRLTTYVGVILAYHTANDAAGTRPCREIQQSDHHRRVELGDLW